MFAVLLFSTSNNKILADSYVVWDNNIGLYAGANMNMHQPDFSILYNIFNKNTTSYTGFGGLEGNFPIFDIMSLGARLNYSVASGDLEDIISSEKSISTLESSLGYLEVNPNVKFYNIFPGLNHLYLTAGFNVGIPIVKDYDIVQEQYSTGLTRTLVETNEIPNAALRTALSVGLGYIIPISNKLYITPEVSYQMPFAKVSTDAHLDSWKVPQLRFGISLNYEAFGDKKGKKVIQNNKNNRFGVSMDQVNYYNRLGERQNTNGILLEEIEYGELFPLVPYIFFEENETTLATEYSNTDEGNLAGVVKEEMEASLPSEAVDLNYRTIDIVGNRLERNKNATITLTGTLDSKSEKNTEVAKGRAEAVKRYLVNNYNIDKDRISVAATKFPAKPSNKNDKDGIVENRRVEITSNSQEILEPIFIKGDRQRVATPEVVEFIPNIDADSITSWTLEIMQSDRLIRKFSGVDPEPIRWHISTNELEASQIPVDYVYTIFYDDESTKTTGSIPVEFVSFSKKKTIDQSDRTINKYSLILFDFDKYNISEDNARIIDKYVIPNIKYKSTIDIFGFTDRIGNKDYNKKLAKNRADAVSDYIHTKNKNVSIRTFGIDSDDAPYDNNTAVGRQLSRTVQIFLITPKD